MQIPRPLGRCKSPLSTGPAHALDLNAPGAIDALLAMHHSTFGDTVMTTPASPDTAQSTPTPTPPAPPPSPPAPATGPEPSRFTDPVTGERYDFPPQTPLTEMKPEQVAEYWRHKARKHEDVAKSRGDYDDLKTKAAEADRLRRERETESEKVIREARETAEREARADERSKAAPQLVRLAFRAAAKGTLTDEARDALVEDLDLTKYLTDKGEVDIDKVERKVSAVAPKRDDKWPATGQGDRRLDTKPSVARGREMFEARRGKKAS